MGKEFPVLPVRDMILFPGVITPLFVGRPRSLKAVERASLSSKKLFVVAQRDLRVEDPKPEDLYEVGTLCRLLQVFRLPDGTTKVLVEGEERARADRYRIKGDYLSADLFPLSPGNEPSGQSEALKRVVLEAFETYVSLHPKVPQEALVSLAGLENPSLLADVVASHMLLKIQEKQELLEMVESEKRLECLLKLILRENDLLELEREIQDRVRQEMEKSQREYFLKEQLKVIQEELGQGEGFGEIQEFRNQIEQAKMPADVEKKAFQELDRFSKMPPLSAEATVVRTYLDWLLAMPWQKASRDCLDLKRASLILNEDHYGLDEVKDRILEFLAVKKLAGKEMRGQVLCFVGPPGVGKTSIARSIARSLGRRFVNMSLGGVRDEAEIRGHRRTYIGALPGRIVQKIRQAETKNPVLLLDEIDKVGNDFRGDPAAALLEVLDPDQNKGFTDHYLEVPFDLSQVMFITTANGTHNIPRPLLDRMEVISFPGYVDEEKVHIAKRHLWPKILQENGLVQQGLSLSDAAFMRVIHDYTLEAGVRGLDRELCKIARKVARHRVEGKSGFSFFKIGSSQIPRLLGAPKLHDALLPTAPTVGAALGLAWTETGGEVLLIETAAMKGRGNVAFTGNLGDIMKESAQTALAYLKSNAERLALEAVCWDKIDLHVHVPQGAVPKEGPSAGLTLALSMFSALSGTPIRTTIAMTGEMTLRGMLLPIGGVREKILAAKRRGIKTLLLPEANHPDVDALPSRITRGLEFHFIKSVLEGLDLALDQECQET